MLSPSESNNRPRIQNRDVTIFQELIGDQSLAVWIVLGTIGFLLTWRGANIVESTTSKISDHFGVSQAVQGGLIVAAATSFPELAISLSRFLYSVSLASALEHSLERRCSIS